MNLGCVGQTFLSAGPADFPAARSRNTGQECEPACSKACRTLAPARFIVPMHAAKRKSAFHEGCKTWIIIRIWRSADGAPAKNNSMAGAFGRHDTMASHFAAVFVSE